MEELMTKDLANLDCMGSFLLSDTLELLTVFKDADQAIEEEESFRGCWVDDNSDPVLCLVFTERTVTKLDLDSGTVKSKLRLGKKICAAKMAGPTSVSVVHQDGSVASYDLKSRVLLNKVSSGLSCPTEMADFNHRGEIASVGGPPSGRQLQILTKDQTLVSEMEEPPSNLIWDNFENVITTHGSTCQVHKKIGGEIRKVFCHDGHKSGIEACSAHPSVKNLVFSTDSSNNLHAWVYAEELT